MCTVSVKLTHYRGNSGYTEERPITRSMKENIDKRDFMVNGLKRTFTRGVNQEKR